MVCIYVYKYILRSERHGFDAKMNRMHAIRPKKLRAAGMSA